MQTYYKGNNIGLNFDAAAGTWSFSNLPQDFIDPNAFSSPDPEFPTAPTEPTTPTDPTPDPCPPGYVYDETLQQCVPDPNVERNFLGNQQGEGQDNPPVKIAGTNRTTTDGNFIASDEEYDAMTPQELIENYKQRGMVDKDNDGNIVIDVSKSLGDKVFDAVIKGTVGKFGTTTSSEADAGQKKNFSRLLEKGLVHSKDNKGNYINTDLLNFKPLGMGMVTAENFPMSKLNESGKENYRIVIPTTTADEIQTNTDTGFTPGFGKLTYDMNLHVVNPATGIYDLTPDIGQKTTSWENYMNNMSNVKTSVTKPVTTTLIEPKTGDASIAEDIYQEKLKQEKEKTKQQEIKTDNEYMKQDFSKRDDSEESGGSYGGGQPQGGYGSGGTTLGSSVHGTGSYNPYGQGDNQGGGSSGGVTGTSVHGGTQYTAPKDKKTCFHPEQLIGNKFIKDLEPGDLINGIKILGMVKLKLDEDMYSLNNVKVTGTHKVKYNNIWMYVFEHPDSFVINDKPEFVYVPIVEGGTFIINNYEFADYDDEHIETLNNKLKVA